MIRIVAKFQAAVISIVVGSAHVTTAVAAPVQPETSQTFQFQLGVVIPVKCRLELSAPATAGGIQNPITMRELCNSRSGYQVLAKYDPSSMNGASVVLDGQHFALNNGGQTVIVDSSLPAIASKQFAFIPAATTPSSATLSLAIMAKI